MCMGILSACMFAYHVSGSHKGGQKTALDPPGKPPFRCWELNRSPLGKAASVNC